MSKEKQSSAHTASLTLAALGVVFGDIGTNPLYALRQCLQNLHTPAAPAQDVLGILSLIFWSLILVVCVKYLTFIFRADHEGEGGTLALLALIHSKRRPGKMSAPGALVLMVLFGSALLYGDGVVTPAISVLSAVEGLKLATPAAGPFVVPVSLVILIALFLVQSRGTGGVGVCFGPIMTLWFLVIALLGVVGITAAPQILAALNPGAAFSFLARHGLAGLPVLGGVVLCFAGAEALFADLGHFGPFPIRAAWYGLVLPSLLLNYFGEGALMLKHPEQAANPFFALVPHWGLYPMVALSTVATVIASQALISGAFSLTEQAIHMGYFPRCEIKHTSEGDRGQVYVSFINYALMIACIGIVLAFRSSERLGSAYGLAVMGTMTITSLTFYVVLREIWKWSRWQASLLIGFFLIIDLAFLSGNLIKILDGAWVPLVLGVLMFAIYWIWTEGQLRFRRAMKDWGMPIDQFLAEMKSWQGQREGTSIFFTSDGDRVPLVGKNDWLRSHMRNEQVILVTVVDQPMPFVPEEKMNKVEKLGPDFFRITAANGFMQHPDITHVLETQPCGELKIDWKCLICYFPETTMNLELKGGWWARTFLAIYRFMRRNALPPAVYFRVPAREILHVSVTLEM